MSAVQAFQWMKALSAKQFITARKLLSLEDSLTIKQIGNDIPSNDNWALSEVNSLRSIAYAKFSQNRIIGERLRTSNFTKFHECTRQTLPTNTREIDSSKFEGNNLFGQILLDVRTKLQQNAQRGSAKAMGESANKSPSKSPYKPTNKPQANHPRKSPGKPASCISESFDTGGLSWQGIET